MVESTPTEVAHIAQLIQLAVAPVFLLSGIGVLLTVLTNRLARIVDRARPLEAQHDVADAAAAGELRRELRWLAHRARLVNIAIALGTLSALLVAMVVALLFGSAFVRFDLAAAVAALFIGAMLALVGALVLFLIEVRTATRTLVIGPRKA